MLNKKIWLKTALLIGSIAGISLSFASTAWFGINLESESIQAIDEQAITDNIMPVHFVDNWNDFGWFIYTPGGEAIEPGDAVSRIWNHYGEVVEFEGKGGYVCSHRVEWFYYNSERWERLFPIDKETADKWKSIQTWLTTNGWLYTNCMSSQLESALAECAHWEEDSEPESDPNSDPNSDPEPTGGVTYDEGQCERDARDMYWYNGYYGMVSHKYNWKDFGLIFGAQYSEDDPWLTVSNSGLAETFIRYLNKYPVGLLYDYHGWVWFVWCEFTGDYKSIGLKNLVNKLNNWSGLNEMFVETGGNVIEYIGGSDVALNCSGVGMAANSIIKIVIEWLVWMWSESNDARVSDQTNPKMQFFKSVNVNNARLVNYAKKKAETLCRWKWIYYDDDDGSVGWFSSYKNHMNSIYSTAGGSWWNTVGNTMENFYNMQKSAHETYSKLRSRYLAQYNKWNGEPENKGHLYCIDLSREDSDKKTIVAEPWYTYIVKWWDVIVSPMMDLSDDNYYYDVYILDGNLLLDNVQSPDKRVISREWFIDYKCTSDSECDNPRLSIESYVTWIENAISEWDDYMGNNAAVGAIIKWNFVVNWNLKKYVKVGGTTTIDSRYFIYWKLTTRDTIQQLQDLFSWRCAGWVSIDRDDEKYCPLSRNGWINPYENAPLVIIDQNYNSPVYN